MRVSRIELNCRQTGAVQDIDTSEYQLVFFRSPVTFTINGSEENFDDITAIIFTEGHKQNYRSKNGEPVKCDIVAFDLSPGDLNYVANMNIPYDVPIRVTNGHMIADILKNMKLRSQVISKNNQEFMELSMRMIFICLGDPGKLVSEDPKASVPKYAKLKKLRDEIYDDPMGDWSVDVICKRLKISHTYFHRIYQMAFGETYRQDVIKSKLRLAADMLANTEKAVWEIARDCGYESESYFMRQFKKHKGITPSEYRRLCQLRQEEEKTEEKAEEKIRKYFT